MKNMQFIDLKAQYRALKDEIDANIRGVLDSAQFIGGPYVKELEAQLAAFTDRKHCITCANGTDALQIAYMVAGVGAGDAVFCPDMTFISSTEPAKMFGATAVFCDITPDTYCLSPAGLERQIQAVLTEGKLTPKAAVAVDILGNPCDYDDDAVDQLCRSLCVHGKGPGGKYDNVRVGMNSRLDAMQAAVLLPKLKALGDYEIDARQQVVERYGRAFAGKLTTPFVAEGCVSAWAQYALLAADTAQRDKIVAHLKEAGIPNMIYYPTPQHALPVFRDEPHYGETFRNADDYCARTFSLPMHPYLEQAEQQQIIDAVLEAL